jgi:hypothetical protein
MNIRQLLLLALTLGLGSTGAATAADSDPASGFSLKGFGTLGLTHSDENNVEFVRDLSQPDGVAAGWSAQVDSVLGLQAGYRFSDQAEGVLQVISRYRYDGGWRPEVSWAFLRYDPDPTLSLRLGRLGTEFYMQADSRLVGYSNLTVRPPADFYHSLVFSYFDGVDASATLPLGQGNLVRGKLFAGVSPEHTPFVQPLTWDLSGSLMLGGHLDYLSGPWQIQLGHARIRLENELPFDALLEWPGFVAGVPGLSAAGTWSGYTSLGLAYDEGPLQILMMLGRIDHETEAYEDSKAGYVVAGYRLGAFTPYLGYSRVKSAPDGNRFATAIRPEPYGMALALAAQTHADQQTLTLGVRWDVQPDLALKFQVDRIDADPSSLFPYREGDGITWDGHMTVFSLALDFVF